MYYDNVGANTGIIPKPRDISVFSLWIVPHSGTHTSYDQQSIDVAIIFAGSHREIRNISAKVAKSVDILELCDIAGKVAKRSGSLPENERLGMRVHTRCETSRRCKTARSGLERDFQLTGSVTRWTASHWVENRLLSVGILFIDLFIHFSRVKKNTPLVENW